MLQASFQNVRRILCLGAHADDIEIGCGGTILKLLAGSKKIDVHWVVLGAGGERADEAARSAEQFLRNAASRKIVIEGFRDSYFPYLGDTIKDYFHQLRDDI